MTIATRHLVVAVALTATTSSVHAQSADAEALFREGKRLMKKGSVAAACEKFDASDRLEPTIGTELNLGDCREKNGQLATAWAIFVKAGQTAKHSGGNAKRGAEAKRRAAALEPKLVYLTISVPEAAKLDGLVIKRNDTVLESALFDQPVPVDPDEYTIVVSAPKHEDWHKKVTIAKKNKTVEVPRLDDSPTATAEVKQPALDAKAKLEPTSKPSPEPERGQSSFTGTRKTAVVFAILGAAAGGVGIVYGLKAKDLERQSDALCPTPACASSDGVDLNRKARSDGLLANIGMIGGGALVTGAIVLWLVGGPSHHEAVSVVPSIDRHGGGVGIVGRF